MLGDKIVGSGAKIVNNYFTDENPSESK